MRCILLIEDDPGQALLEERLIRGDGHDVVHAPDFATGLKLTRERKIACAVVDLGLPDVTDFDTVARFHELGVPIVALTGSGNDDLLKAVRDVGATYVQKPGGKLLLTEIWSQINFRDATAESLHGQRVSQSKIIEEEQESVLKETTKVTIGLARVFAIITTIIAGSVGITYYVAEKLNSVNSNVTNTRAEIASIRADFASYVATSNRRQDGFDADMRLEKSDKERRLLNLSKWQWTISRDVRLLGEKVGVQIFTKDPE